MENVCWRFPSNNYGENRGFRDSGAEHFKDNKISSLARETCQNSLDAAISESCCVKLEFKLFEISPERIPGRDSLLDAFYRLIEYWKEKKDNDAKYICNRAINILSSSSCKVLRISDFNTTGLSGIQGKDRLSPWYNLVKFSGASDKSGDAGGSFGIGKYSSFACSALNTVFYSTCNKDNEMAYQGVSRLATFIDEEGQTTQGIGYYGNDKNTPVFSQLKLDDTFERKEKNYGTDIYIIGYEGEQDTWEDKLISSIIDGFFYAIHVNKLSINVNGKIVNSSSLSNIIEHESSLYLDKITPYYYKALITAETEKLFFKKPLLGIGDLYLWLIAKDSDDGKKSIAMIRKTGMKIYDDTPCACGLNVAGVCYIDGSELNNKLKELENPAHTSWSVNRSVNPKQAKALLDALKKEIKTTVLERFSHSDQESFDALGMGKYLPDEDSTDITSKKRLIISNDIERIKKRKKIINKQEISMQTATEGNTEDYIPSNAEENTFSPDSDGSTQLHNGNSDNNGTKKQMGSQDPDSKETERVGKVYKAATLNKFLPICVDMKKGVYSLIIEPASNSDDGKVSLYISAETDKYPISIRKAKPISFESEIKVIGNTIQGLIFKKSEILRLMVELDYSEACSLEVEAYEAQK